MLKSVCLHISSFCNLQCTHCWSNSGPSENAWLAWEDIDTFASTILPLGLERISLSGGEPLLHPKISRIVNGLLKKQLRVVITTNGTLPLYVARLLETLTIDQQRMIEFRVSVDGPEYICNTYRGKDVYQKSLKCIEFIKSTLGKVFVNCVVGLEGNKEDWLHFFNHLANLQVDEVALITLSPRGRGRYEDLSQKILNHVELVKNTARQSEYEGRVLVWDYLTVQHGYLLVEHNGKVILPGFRDEDDLIIGMINSITMNEIKHVLDTARNRLNYSYPDSR